MVAPAGDEQIRYDILIEAQSAIKSLQLLLRATEDNQAKIMQFSEVVLAQSKLWGVSWQQALNVYRQLNAELSKQKSATLFGKTGGVDLFSGTEKYISGLEQAGRLTDQVTQKTDTMGKTVEASSNKAVRGINAIRIAFSVLASMIVFQVIQAITQFFTGAIEQAKQFETTLYRLANAERQLSLEGLEVSLKGLKKGIEDIKKAFPIFSKEDIAELVGSLAVSTKELGFNEEQILKLGAAISILNLNSSETESLLQTQAKVTNSLISPQARSIGALGLSFGKAKIEAKAFEMQILKTGETFDDLTEKEKTEIKYQIILETAGIEGVEGIEELRDLIQKSGGDFGALIEFLESDTAKLMENSAAWKDLQTAMGQVLLPFLPALTSFIQLITDGLNFGKVVIIEFVTAVTTLGIALTQLFTGQITSVEDFTNTIKTSVATLREELVNKFFKEMPTDAPEWFKRRWGDLIKEQAETGTSGIEGLNEAVEQFDASEMIDEIDDIIDKAQEAQEDLDIDFGRKSMDIDIEYDRKAEDALIDYQRNVEEINQDTENRVQEIRDRAREEDLRREEEYQNKLWELQQQYLMDLEDALHERDARQIIRLQRQYEFEQERLARENELEAEQSQREEESDIGEVRQDQQIKLEEARLHYEQKIQDLNTAKAREQADLQLWYDREQEDIQLAQQRQLQALIEGWVEKGLVTQENAQAVYDIIASYFGPGGLTDGIWMYMQASLANAQAMALAGLNTAGVGNMYVGQGVSVPTGASQPAASSGGTYVGQGVYIPSGLAEGGSFLATTPQSLKVAESGPELVTATPLGRTGQDVNKLFMGANLGESASGMMEIGVTLSPDLEARVIRKTLDETAGVILKVNRTKV